MSRFWLKASKLRVGELRKGSKWEYEYLICNWDSTPYGLTF